MNTAAYKSFRRNLVFSSFIKAMRLFPIDKDKVVVSNFAGRGYGDNPKYVADKLHELGSKKIYCLVKDVNVPLPDYVTPLRYESFESFYHLATAGIWIDNIRKEPYISKRRGQYYYQCWHGALALKKIEKDALETLSEKYVEEAKRDSKMVDLMVSNCEISQKMFENSFWYDGEVVKLGSPRLDNYITASEGILKQQGLVSDDDFVILYAPTFRNNGNTEVFDIDLKMVADAFGEKTGKNVKTVVKLHPNMAQMQLDNLKGEDIIDTTSYPDIYQIMPDCDVIITDYSSLMFEFPMASDKPVFIYARDYQDYDRGFYFDLRKLPFPFAENNDSLKDNIVNFNQEAWLKAITGFFSEIELYEPGNAARQVAEYILKKTGSKQ